MKQLTVTDGKRHICMAEGGEWSEVSGFTSRYEIIGWIITHFSGRGKANLITKIMKDIDIGEVKVFMDKVLTQERVTGLLKEIADKINMDIDKLRLIWNEVENLYEKVGFLQFELRDNKMAKGINKIATKIPDNIMVRLDEVNGHKKGNRVEEQID